MKNKYTIGLDGNLISESFISNILNEQGKTAAELAAEARAKRASTGSAQPATTTKSTSTTAKTTSTGEKSEKQKFKDILDRGNTRALEHIIYETALTPIMHLWWSNQLGPFTNEWSDTSLTKKYFPNLQDSGKNPLSEFRSYAYWYDPTIKKIFGPSKTFKENILTQEGWYYDNVWLGLLQTLNEIPWYKVNKDTYPPIKAIFEKVYYAGQQIMANLYDSPGQYKIEIPYTTKLQKDPDEFEVYVQQALATKADLKYPEFSSKTVIEQLQNHTSSLVGVISMGSARDWRSALVNSTYIGKVTNKRGSEQDYVPLRKN
jgi:hypothetical protein